MEPPRAALLHIFVDFENVKHVDAAVFEGNGATWTLLLGRKITCSRGCGRAAAGAGCSRGTGATIAAFSPE